METDFLIIGSGVAGLSAAIEAAHVGKVLVLTKDRLTESASEYAQGGVAVALSDDDQVNLHEQDTLQAGAGLCDPRAVKSLTEEGPDRIQKLIEWGAEFDTDGGNLTFGLEGAHSVRRILHANGDSTGREIASTLFRKAQSIDNISFQSFSSVVDLLVEDGEVCGAIAWNEHDRELVPVYARAVLLATGGIGGVYRETTNPDVATGDGVAMAYRAGALIANIEMVQFHPTALFLEGVPRFLLSEALRGEGAVLRNANMQRFMSRYHESEELAPRDIVSRSIIKELERLRRGPVYLDLTHLDSGLIRKKFIAPACSTGSTLNCNPCLCTLPLITPWVESSLVVIARHQYPGFSPPGKLPATESTGQIDWPATHCLKDWFSGRWQVKACGPLWIVVSASHLSANPRQSAHYPAMPSPTCGISPGNMLASYAQGQACVKDSNSWIYFRCCLRKASPETADTASRQTTCTRSFD